MPMGNPVILARDRITEHRWSIEKLHNYCIVKAEHLRRQRSTQIMPVLYGSLKMSRIQSHLRYLQVQQSFSKLINRIINVHDLIDLTN